MTTLQLFLLPIFVHIALITVVGLRTVAARIAAVRSGKTKLGDIATSNEAWDRAARQLGNNFNNQFETPTLWYGATALMVATNLVDGVGVILSWLFLLSRLVHSWIHTGSNNVPARMRAFLAGFTVLVVLWAWFALRLFAVG